MHDDDEDDMTQTAFAIPAPAQLLADSQEKTGFLLVVSSGAAHVAGQMFKLSGSETFLGRATDAELRIDDDGVSRKHVKFTCTGPGRYALTDLGSRNGTFVNGDRISSCELKDGDKVQVGSTTVLLFSLQDEHEEQFTMRLFESATHDGLTKLLNKKYFLGALEKELAFCARYRAPMSLMMIDVDHFKRINDTHGHPAGDQVLIRTAARLAEVVRKEDVLARYGGEEFVSLLRNADEAAAAICAERCRHAVEALELTVGQAHLQLTISIGVATLRPGTPASIEALIAHADKNLYEAKRSGRNQVRASAFG